MSEVNTYPHIQPVNYGALPQQVNTPAGAIQVKDVKERVEKEAKEKATNNPVARVIKGIKENDSIMGFMYTIGVFTLANQINNFLITTTNGQSHFNKFLNSMDKNPLAIKADKAIMGFNDKVAKPVLGALSAPLRPLIKHFSDHWRDVNPKFEAAIVMSRDKVGQMTDSLYDAAMNKFDGNIKESYETIKRLSIKNKVGDKIDELIKKQDFEGIRKLFGNITDDHPVSKALGVLNGEQGKNFCQLIGWKKNKNVPWDEAYNRLKGIMGDQFDTPAFKYVDDQLRASTELITNNGAIKEGSERIGTVFSRRLRALYRNTNDYFNFHFMKNGGAFGILMTIGAAMALGTAIQNTIKAPKEDKLSTFMEGITGDVVPFVLMDRIIKCTYGLLGGVREAGANGNILWNAATKPVRWTGNLLTTGLGKNVKWYSFKGLFGSATRLGLIITASTILGNQAMKLSYKLFGKPQKTIAEEEKAKAEEAKAKTESQKTEGKEKMSIGQFPTQLNTNINSNYSKEPPPLVKARIEQMRNNANNNTSPIPGQAIGTNSQQPVQPANANNQQQTPEPPKEIGAKSLNPGQSSFFEVPEPISGTNPATLAKLNTVMAKIDQEAAKYGI